MIKLMYGMSFIVALSMWLAAGMDPLVCLIGFVLGPFAIGGFINILGK